MQSLLRTRSEKYVSEIVDLVKVYSHAHDRISLGGCIEGCLEVAALYSSIAVRVRDDSGGREVVLHSEDQSFDKA